MRQHNDTDKRLRGDETEGFSLQEQRSLNGSERTRILIICPIIGRSNYRAETLSPQRAGRAIDDFGTRDQEAKREEAIGLAQAIDLDIVNTLMVPIQRPRPSTLIGSGKVDEIKRLVNSSDIELVFVDAVLSPVQQRNLEREWSCKILDRTGLILEIFGARAQTREGRLQVELAHLQYQKSRLVRSWTHLERQRGGFGFLGGPGETQIEADKRLIQERIRKIEKLLAKVRRTRALHRGSRKRVPYPVIALVGYTNAGKSTLFNHLTEAKVDAKDLLFATLDPTLRATKLPGGRDVILSDTVGFVSDLPHELVAAFRSTLEEVIEADLIIHVRDISHADSEAQARDVAEVLKEIGIGVEDETKTTPMIEAWNKADLLDDETRENLQNVASRMDHVVLISAATGDGLNDLLQKIEANVGAGEETRAVTLGFSEGKKINWIYEHCDVLDRDEKQDHTVKLNVRIPQHRRGEFIRKFGANPVQGGRS